MSLDTYTNLKAELVAWTGRSDESVSAGGIDTYIDLAEAWFNRNLRVEQMVTTNGSLTVSAGGSITHPTDWLAWKQIAILNTPIQVLPAQSEGAALNYDNSNAVGYPVMHVVRGGATQVWPAPDGTYTYQGIYYRTIPALTGSNATNWLLTSFPDAYLFGALLMGHARMNADDRVPMWQAAFDRVIAEIDTASIGDAFISIGSPLKRNVV